MLLHVSIRNIVLIETLDIPFQSGLIVLTGETGAGKSILLDALGFALGGRGNARLLRHGAEQGSVTAEFDITENPAVVERLDQQGFGRGETVLLRRVLYKDGKSRAFINDTPVSIALLREIGDLLVEVHGQHDQRGLLDAAAHRMLVDAFGQLDSLVLEVNTAYDTYKKLEEELNIINDMEQNIEKEEQYLRHVQKELIALAPQQGEEETLAEERAILMQKERLAESVQSALNELKGSTDVYSALLSAQRVLTRHTPADTGHCQIAIDALERASVETADALQSLEGLLEGMDAQRAALEQIQERLFALREAARKYRMTADDLPAYLEEVEKKISLLEGNDIQKEALQQALVVAREAYASKTQALTSKRKKTAAQLEEILIKELAPLKMEGTCFNVAIDVLPESEWSRHGVDRVRFLVSTNPGAPLDELSKIASGGELSRFMLALKVVLAKVKSVPTLIFDEVDTGIGGAVADAVGKRLELLGKHAQVLVVTHQPQVAARGGMHLHIKKTKRADKTFTTVDVLATEQRKEELARMLAGATITKEARAAAESLLELA